MLLLHCEIALTKYSMIIITIMTDVLTAPCTKWLVYWAWAAVSRYNDRR